MRLRFAFAVNDENRIAERHFGDADIFLIYTFEAGKMVLSSEETSNFKSLDAEHEHVSIR